MEKSIIKQYLEENNNKPFICEFCGGKYNGQTYTLQHVMYNLPVERLTADLSEIRAKGGIVHRAELDNKPVVDGYLEPMWNGTETIGTDCGKMMCYVLRYETQDVYDMLSR